MTPEIFPLGQYNVDIDQFNYSASKIFRTNITSKIDKLGLNLSDFELFLASIIGITREDQNILNALKNNSFILQHLFFGFIVICDEEDYLDFLSYTDLKTFSKKTEKGIIYFIASGNLKQWKDSIINICSEDKTYNIRILFDKFLLYFEKVGLQHVFDSHKKVALPDKSFKLLEK